jgi:hypothetical protein
MNLLRRTTSLAVLLFCVVISADGQTKGPIYGSGANNDDAKAILDSVAHSSEPDKLIIMIARNGDRESPNINWRRLKTAGEYLENTRAIPKSRFVTAVGRRVHGSGRLEIYVDGKLLVVFTFRRNRDFAPEP